jgi:2-dehydropantoate 2-reductase
MWLAGDSDAANRVLFSPIQASLKMKIAVFGSGLIGTYVGGSLRAAGADVVLIGRARMQQHILEHGLVLTDLQKRRVRLAAADIPFALTPDSLADADLILVTVKSSATAEAAEAIARYAKPSAVVLSLQNGIGNSATLKKVLTENVVLAGMVPFNVVQTPDHRLHRGSDGEVMVEASPSFAPWQPLFAAAALPLLQHADFVAVQWGKLLLNLNNSVNALSALPLKTQLSQRAYRCCLALLVDEGLAVLARAGIEPAQVTRIAPRRLPLLLRLPDFLFTRIAAQMLRIDPEARSSMAEDLQAGRLTEIDYLNGAVVALAKAHGGDAPANRRMVALVRQAESGAHAAYEGPKLLSLLRNQ